MKIKGLLILLTVIICSSLSSCSKDEDGGFSKHANEQHRVVLKVFSNTKGIPFSVQSGLIVKDYWESEYDTKESFTQINARCDDATVLLTGEIYVDGKLKLKSEANSYLILSASLK